MIDDLNFVYEDWDADSDKAPMIRTATDRVGMRIPDLVIDGRSEHEILAAAPVLTCDRVYFTTDREVDIQQIADRLPMKAYTRAWSDGTHRIWVDAGNGDAARTGIKKILADLEVEVSNARIDRSVGFRDLSEIDGTLIGELTSACANWLYSRSGNIQARIVAEIEELDEADMLGMLYLFVHDHLDRFDGERVGKNGRVNLTAFMYGKLRNWPQDLVRARYGRTLIDDRVALHRIDDEIAREHGRTATIHDRARALGVSVTDLHQREGTLLALNSLSIDEAHEDGHQVLSIADDEADTERQGMEADAQAELTRRMLDAVHQPGSTKKRDQNPLGLVSMYLLCWEDQNRAQIAETMEVMPKTVTAALSRVTEGMDKEGLAT